MVQLNKDECVWVYFEMARVQNAHAVQRLCSICWPGRRVPCDTQELQKIHAAWH